MNASTSDILIKEEIILLDDEGQVSHTDNTDGEDENCNIYYYNSNNDLVYVNQEKFSWKYCFVNLHRGLNVKEMSTCKQCTQTKPSPECLEPEIVYCNINDKIVHEKLSALKKFVEEDPQQEDAKPPKKMKAAKKSKPYFCEECDKGFTTFQSFQQHLTRPVHIEKKPYRCNRCNQTFDFLSNLYLHFEVHKYEPTCNLCGKSFKTFQHLKQHSMTHEKPFACNIGECKKRFSRLQYLKQHIVSHTNPRKFKCEYCNKAFNFKDNLKKHVRSHERDIGKEEKIYSCFECEKSFADSLSLKEHLLDHYNGNNVKYEIDISDVEEKVNLKSDDPKNDCFNSDNSFHLEEKKDNINENNNCNNFKEESDFSNFVEKFNHSTNFEEKFNHSNNFNEGYDDSTSNLKGKKNTNNFVCKEENNNSYVCGECELRFEEKESLLNHAITHDFYYF